MVDDRSEPSVPWQQPLLLEEGCCQVGRSPPPRPPSYPLPLSTAPACLRQGSNLRSSGIASPSISSSAVNTSGSDFSTLNSHSPIFSSPATSTLRMKAFLSTLLCVAALTKHASAQSTVCSASDFEKIKGWMAACDKITNGAAAQCADRACHAALHRLEEQETKDCWVSFGGAPSAFDKYAAIDASCHGGRRVQESNTTVGPTSPVCSIEDGLTIFTWMNACDSVVGDLAAKCADRDCHAALHRLEEEETHECWEFLGLGTHEDFDKYEAIDAFCHGNPHSGDHDH